MEVIRKVKDETEKLIEKVLEEGIPSGHNLEYLDKLVDIQKDISEMEGSGNMNYGNYGNYNRYGERYSENYGEGNYGERYGRRMRDSQGRFMGDDIRSKSEEILEHLNRHYGNYSGSRAMYNRGDYGAKDEEIQSLNYMLESVVDFIAMLKREAKTQDEKDLIKRYMMTLGNM